MFFKMRNQKSEVMNLEVTEGLTVTVYPNPDHEFLMTTREVAAGYGVTEYAIRKNKMSLGDELREGKHFISAVTIGNGQGRTVSPSMRYCGQNAASYV